MRSEDLAPLLVGSGRPGLGFHSGTVLSWDPNTGHNTVQVAGAVLTDVPVLNTGETIALQAGHVVALLRSGSSYFILGRVAIPGSSQFAGSSIQFAGYGHWETTFGIGTSPAAKSSMELAGPTWADEAQVYMTCTAYVGNPTATANYLYLQPKIDTFTGQWEGTPLAASGGKGQVVGVQNGVFHKSDRGGVGFDVQPLSFEAQLWADHAMASDPANIAQVHAMAIFRSTS
jgi:hypothetical protein